MYVLKLSPDTIAAVYDPPTTELLQKLFAQAQPLDATHLQQQHRSNADDLSEMQKSITSTLSGVAFSFPDDTPPAVVAQFKIDARYVTTLPNLRALVAIRESYILTGCFETTAESMTLSDCVLRNALEQHQTPQHASTNSLFIRAPSETIHRLLEMHAPLLQTLQAVPIMHALQSGAFMTTTELAPAALQPLRALLKLNAHCTFSPAEISKFLCRTNTKPLKRALL